MDDERIGLGVIGCGGFGLFALQQFTQEPGEQWLRDRDHRRVVTEWNGRESLAVACRAGAMAHQSGDRR